MANEENVQNNNENNKNIDIIVLITILSIPFSIFPSLIYYFLRKKELNTEEKTYTLNLLNFELTMIAIWLACHFVVILAPISWLTAIFNLIMLIVGTIKTWKKEQFKYPLALNLVK